MDMCPSKQSSHSQRAGQSPVLKSHANRTLHLWFFSMQDFKWPSLTKRYNQLVLSAFIKIFNSVFLSFNPPTIA